MSGRLSAQQEAVESFGPAFARRSAYWRLLALSIVVGLFVGLIGWLHTFIVYLIMNGWATKSLNEQLSGFFTGEVWYIAVVAGGGLTNGIIQVRLDEERSVRKKPSYL